MLKLKDISKENVLKLQSFSLPPLAAGKYVVKTKLFNQGTDLKGMPSEIPVKDLFFTVAAPRFSIGTDLIHSTYPLSGSSGAYSDNVPHIVLRQKTFPWGRVIKDGLEGVRKPWVCLLSFTESELKNSILKEVEVKDFLTAKNGVLVPKLGNGDDIKEVTTQKMKMLEIDLVAFKKSAPLVEELSYLVHTREVSITNKGNDVNQDNGAEFSVVVGNRLPEPGEINSAFLVSIEGCYDYLKNEVSAENTDRIRLCVLHEWKFIDMGEPFAEIINKLSQNVKPLMVELDQPENASANVKEAIGYGYTPINHDRRNDDLAVSWYRGPFIPLNIDRIGPRFYKNADEALRFDDKTGMFDISYASAWQLGRLLALEDPDFSKSLNKWSNDYKVKRPEIIAEKLIVSKTVGIDVKNLSALVTDAVADDVLTDYLIELWNENLNPKAK